MYTVSKSYSFSAAHRLEGHPKCGRLHGHNYVVEVGLSSKEVDTAGMVIDFADINKLVEPIIDGLDHMYLVSQENINNDGPYWKIAQVEEHARILPIDETTAEMLAVWFYNKFSEKLKEDFLPGTIDVTEVRVWETPKAHATYRPW